MVQSRGGFVIATDTESDFKVARATETWMFLLGRQDPPARAVFVRINRPINQYSLRNSSTVPGW